MGEVLPGDANGHGLINSGRTGDALAVFDNCHVANDAPLGNHVEDDLLAVLGDLVDLHAAFEEEVHAFGGVAGLKKYLAWAKVALGEQWNEALQLLVGEDAHHLAQLAQVPRDRTLQGLPPSRGDVSWRAHRSHPGPPVPP